MTTAAECRELLESIPEGGRLRSGSGMATIEPLEGGEFSWIVGNDKTVLDKQSATRRLSKYRPEALNKMRMEWPDEAWQYEQEQQTKREEIGMATKNSNSKNSGEKKPRQKSEATFYTKPKGGNIGYRGAPTAQVLAKKHNFMVSGDGATMVNSVHISPGKLTRAVDEQKLLPGKGKQLTGKYDPSGATKVLTLDREPTDKQRELLRGAYPEATYTVKEKKPKTEK